LVLLEGRRQALNDQAILDKLLGLNGQPDPIAAALSRIDLPRDIDREDVAQHVRSRILEHVAKGDTPVNPFSFAFTATLRTSLNLVRNAKGRSRRRIDKFDFSLFTSAEPSEDSFAAAWEVRKAIERIQCPAIRDVATAISSGYCLPDRIAEVRTAKRVLRDELLRGRGIVKPLSIGEASLYHRLKSKPNKWHARKPLSAELGLSREVVRNRVKKWGKLGLLEWKGKKHFRLASGIDNEEHVLRLEATCEKYSLKGAKVLLEHEPKKRLQAEAGSLPM
jgi:hypothetical protein